MLVFIDESGDPGFKVKRGSTSYFVVALVIFDDELEAEETALKIKKLRRSLKKTDRFEFKFNKCSKKYRIKFLSTVKSCKFRVRAIVFQKDKIYSKNLRISKDRFYNYAIKMVLKHNNESIKGAKIRLDGLGERLFRRNLTAYLRRSLNAKEKIIIKNLRFRDSRKDVLIQLADMVVGSIARSYSKRKTDCEEYKKIIKKRIEDIWEFK